LLAPLCNILVLLTFLLSLSIRRMSSIVFQNIPSMWRVILVMVIFQEIFKDQRRKQGLYFYLWITYQRWYFLISNPNLPLYTNASLAWSIWRTLRSNIYKNTSAHYYHVAISIDFVWKHLLSFTYLFFFLFNKIFLFKVCWNDKGLNGLNKGKIEVYQDIMTFKAPNRDISSIKKVGLPLSIMTHFGVCWNF
jgi:hypothetical protein